LIIERKILNSQQETNEFSEISNEKFLSTVIYVDFFSLFTDVATL